FEISANRDSTLTCMGTKHWSSTGYEQLHRFQLLLNTLLQRLRLVRGGTVHNCCVQFHTVTNFMFKVVEDLVQHRFSGPCQPDGLNFSTFSIDCHQRMNRDNDITNKFEGWSQPA